MATEKFDDVPHTIYRGTEFYRFSKPPNVRRATHEGDNDGFFIPCKTLLTLTFSDGTQCTGWKYMGLTNAIKGGPYLVVAKENYTYVLGTGDADTPGNVGNDEKKVPLKTSELSICRVPHNTYH